MSPRWGYTQCTYSKCQVLLVRERPHLQDEADLAKPTAYFVICEDDGTTDQNFMARFTAKYQTFPKSFHPQPSAITAWFSFAYHTEARLTVVLPIKLRWTKCSTVPTWSAKRCRNTVGPVVFQCFQRKSDHDRTDGFLITRSRVQISKVRISGCKKWVNWRNKKCIYSSTSPHMYTYLLTNF